MALLLHSSSFVLLFLLLFANLVLHKHTHTHISALFLLKKIAMTHTHTAVNYAIFPPNYLQSFNYHLTPPPTTTFLFEESNPKIEFSLSTSMLFLPPLSQLADA